MKISIARYDGALASAIHGVSDLVLIANAAVASIGGAAALSSEILDIQPGKEPSPELLGDVVFLPPLLAPPGAVTLMAKQLNHVVDWIRSLGSTEPLICGCCTAVTLVAEAGLLDGRKATTTWWLIPEVAKAYPRIDLQSQEMLVRDGRFITSAGPFSYISSVLSLIEHFAGSEIARLCAKIAVVEPGRPSNGIFVVPNLYTIDDPLMRRAQEVITQDLADGVTVSSVARKLGLSERTFLRRTREKAGISPRDLIARTRIEVAKTMLETSAEPIVRVASAVGFDDDSSFRSAFSRSVGITPSAYRARMNSGANAPTTTQRRKTP